MVVIYCQGNIQQPGSLRQHPRICEHYPALPPFMLCQPDNQVRTDARRFSWRDC